MQRKQSIGINGNQWADAPCAGGEKETKSTRGLSDSHPYIEQTTAPLSNLPICMFLLLTLLKGRWVWECEINAREVLWLTGREKGGLTIQERGGNRKQVDRFEMAFRSCPVWFGFIDHHHCRMKPSSTLFISIPCCSCPYCTCSRSKVIPPFSYICLFSSPHPCPWLPLQSIFLSIWCLFFRAVCPAHLH